MEKEEEVVLLDCFASAFGMRVRIALAEKGVQYELVEEDLTVSERSPLLLQMNPVHKMIPVLIHNGKPICESLIILQYIDEVWRKASPLLPEDPHKGAIARFWADFIDKKVYDCGARIVKSKAREAQEDAKKGLIENLKLLEEVLEEKPFFGGESFGFLDVAFIPFSSWFYAYGLLGDFKIEEECPKLMAWVERCKAKESVTKTLADPLEVYNFACKLRKRLGIE